MPSSRTAPRLPVIWIGSARDDMRAMPEDVKDIFGKRIDDAQIGVFPRGARPFGEGLPHDVLKLVANDDGETYRCAYVVAFRGVIYVLHVFQKIEIRYRNTKGRQESHHRTLQSGEATLCAVQVHVRHTGTTPVKIKH